MKTPGIWIAVGVLVFFTITGCSSKNVASTSDGTETGQSSASKGGVRGGAGGSGSIDEYGALGDGTPGSRGPGRRGPDGAFRGGIPGSGGSGQTGKDGAPGSPGSSGGTLRDGQPLTGFSQKGGEESVDGGPMMMSKADQETMENRQARRTREDARKVLVDIYFAFDRWGLSEEGKRNLSQSADFLRRNPTAKLVIEGHCDERGSREYNLALGEKRAKETRHYLSDLGIHNAVAITSYGKERPSCNEQNESCYSKNRRAQLAIEPD
jgi:peptidoglycan-associated lipoprotein